MRLCLFSILTACGTAQIASTDSATDSGAPSAEDCESADSTTWFFDLDGDGYGDEAISAPCQPDDTVEIDGDCNDDNEHTYPGAEDICDGQDNDCNGEIDDGEAGTLQTWYSDLDGDGYGYPIASMEGCIQPNGHVANSEDCDDNNDGVYPGAPEICDDVANDCLGDRDGWISDDGMATFYSTDTESHTDISDQLSLDADAPAALTLTEPGQLTLCNGTWHTRLTLAADEIEVIGLNGPEYTILDAGGSGPVVTISAGHSASLEGLALINGAADQGGGVYVAPAACPDDKEDDEDADKEDDEDTDTKQGAAQLTSPPAIVLDEMLISGNSASEGGGVYAVDCVDLDIDDSTLSGNSAQTGGGIYVGTADQSEVSLFLNDSILSSNAADTGGGLWSGASWASILDTAISENSAQTGGGMAISGGVYIYSSSGADTLVTANSAETGGGAWLESGAWLYADTVDWGGEEDTQTGKTAEDNSPDDVNGASLSGAPYDFGIDASFSCEDDKGCIEDNDKTKEKQEASP